MATARQWNSIATIMANQVACPIGTRALYRGISDYRKQPSLRMDAADWAVWLVEWDGKEWQRVKRLAANKTLAETWASLKHWGDQLGLRLVE